MSERDRQRQTDRQTNRDRDREMRRKTGGGEEGTVETLAPKYIIPPHREKERKRIKKNQKNRRAWKKDVLATVCVS